MSVPYSIDDRFADLLIQQATSGLTAAEAAELGRLSAAYPDADSGSIERTVVALSLAARDDGEPLPASLRARLLRAAPGAATSATVTDLDSHRAARPTTDRGRSMVGWWAAAAAVLIAIAGWYPRLAPPQHAPDAAALRAQLIAASATLVRWEFSATADPAAHGARGDVVWDPVSQRGYMRFTGLSANDAQQMQYQLWIFDGERDDRYPVDGGVFDIPAVAGEVVIPIRARLHVGKPALFAVTAERPGGVVVSGRERIVVLAKPAST